MIPLLLIITNLFSLNVNKDELNSFINSQLKGYTKIVWEVSSLPNGITSLDDDKLQINKEGNLKLNGEYLYVPVKIKRNDGKFSNSIVTLKVKLYKQVYTAIKVIQKSSVIDVSDLMILETDVTGLRSNPVTDFEEGKIYRAKLTIKSGSIIEENFVEELPLILIGDKVKAIKQVGNVTISFDAKAREDGKLGEIIRIIREDGKTFKAKIESKETVIIIE